MCPYDYYTEMRHAIDPKHLRLRLVRYAQEHGVKPAAQAFGSTPKTVCKWLAIAFVRDGSQHIEPARAGEVDHTLVVESCP